MCNGFTASNSELDFMHRAVSLALNGEGKTAPNPIVGAVIVKNGKIIGEGWHHVCGGLHAEREALKDCFEKGENPESADMYVTLEPCCHFGRQAPCTQSIIEAKIKRVIIGSKDPNPLVAGKGISFLRESGIEVVENFLKDECDKLNSVFFHYITSGMPYAVLKYAMTADGKICSCTGDSKWISGKTSREYVHRLRNRYSAIMVGIGTVLSDNPLLTARGDGFKNPVRIICDSKLKIPLDCNIIKTAKEVRTIIAAATESKTYSDKIKALENSGAELLFVSGKVSENIFYLNLQELFKMLGKMQIDSILIEGGSEINYSILESKLVNKVCCFIAPKILGGLSAKSPVGGNGIKFVSDAFKLKLEEVKMFDEDVFLEYEVL